MENYTTSNMENNRKVGLLLTPQVKEFIKYYLEAAIISIYPSPKAYLIPQELPELIAFGGLANLYNQCENEDLHQSNLKTHTMSIH